MPSNLETWPVPVKNALISKNVIFFSSFWSLHLYVYSEIKTLGVVDHVQINWITCHVMVKK